MDEEVKSVGESSSNNNQSRSLTDGHKVSSHPSNSSKSKPSSSNSSHKQQQQQQAQQHDSNESDMALDSNGGDEIGWWDCSLCTYKNSADKFKCEICDLRRGTSTRKPRCNADTIVAQVVKQQEQIRQQTRAPKTPKRSSTSAGNNSAATSSTDSKPKQQQHPTKSKAVSEPSDVSDASSDETSIYESSSESSSSSSSAASAVTSTDKFSDNPFKVTPFEVNGNLIKYSPPTSSGRTGLIIDKKRFTQHSVTVNDVTITFTEFATRQNRYIRKKKKRRDNRTKTVANGKN